METVKGCAVVQNINAKEAWNARSFCLWQSLCWLSCFSEVQQDPVAADLFKPTLELGNSPEGHTAGWCPNSSSHATNPWCCRPAYRLLSFLPAFICERCRASSHSVTWRGWGEPARYSLHPMSKGNGVDGQNYWIHVLKRRLSHWEKLVNCSQSA